MVILKRIFGGKFSVEITPKNLSLQISELELALSQKSEGLTYQEAVDLCKELEPACEKHGLKVVIK